MATVLTLPQMSFERSETDAHSRPQKSVVMALAAEFRLAESVLMVAAATASQRGLEVEAEVKSAADGSFVCGPLRLGGVRRGDVEAVCWPSVTLRVGPGAKALYSEVFGKAFRKFVGISQLIDSKQLTEF